jgi:hypothetical protein
LKRFKITVTSAQISLKKKKENLSSACRFLLESVSMPQQPGQEDHKPHPLRDFKEYQNALFTALTGATRAANAIPIADLGYFRSLDRGFAKTLDSCSEKVLNLSNNMLKYASVDDSEAAPRFYDIDDVMDRYGIAIDVVDNLLEKAVSEWSYRHAHC